MGDALDLDRFEPHRLPERRSCIRGSRVARQHVGVSQPASDELAHKSTRDPAPPPLLPDIEPSNAQSTRNIRAAAQCTDTDDLTRRPDPRHEQRLARRCIPLRPSTQRSTSTATLRTPDERASASSALNPSGITDDAEQISTATTGTTYAQAVDIYRSFSSEVYYVCEAVARSIPSRSASRIDQGLMQPVLEREAHPRSVARQRAPISSAVRTRPSSGASGRIHHIVSSPDALQESSTGCRLSWPCRGRSRLSNADLATNSAIDIAGVSLLRVAWAQPGG